MEISQPTEIKKTSGRNLTLAVVGILIILISCAALLGALYLDMAGEQATGELSNASTGCSGGKTCWTGKMDFTTMDGEKISFYPLTFPLLFDLDPALSGRPYEAYGNYEVHYVKSFPQAAKVSLAFYLEYLNMFCGLGLGMFLFLLGYLISNKRDGTPRKPMVIDLSRFGKKD